MQSDSEMMLGNMLIVWSIRLSMLLLVATLLAWLWTRNSTRVVSAMWTLSFVLFLVHVISSFHFVHEWSHHKAYAATAIETRELMGVEFGGGVYFNYVFLIAWAVHVGITWFPSASGNRAIRILLQLCLIYMLFIAFNGVVVFKSGWLRALGLMATAMIIAAAISKWFSARNGGRVAA